MFSIRSAYTPPMLKLSRPKAIGRCRLARALARMHGGDGDAHLLRLMRIAATDRDPRSLRALKVLLVAMRAKGGD